MFSGLRKQKQKCSSHFNKCPSVIIIPTGCTVKSKLYVKEESEGEVRSPELCLLWNTYKLHGRSNYTAVKKTSKDTR